MEIVCYQYIVFFCRVSNDVPSTSGRLPNPQLCERHTKIIPFKGFLVGTYKGLSSYIRPT
jgi:hypothetical protein